MINSTTQLKLAKEIKSFLATTQCSGFYLVAIAGCMAGTEGAAESELCSLIVASLRDDDSIAARAAKVYCNHQLKQLLKRWA